MAAFNYRQLIRQVPPRTWQFYFQSRKVELPADHAWDMPAQKLIPALIKVTDALPDHQSKRIYAELRRVHELANPRGVDALRNTAPLDVALHEDFPKLSSDAERALWVMANWPEQFAAAEAIYGVNLRVGKRGWKRLQVEPTDGLHRESADIQALELALAAAFTPRKGTPRACQIDSLERHLDGGVQLGILIEDNAQRNLEFGNDNRVHWRDVRPPLTMDVVIYPASGVIDIIAPGGAKAQKAVLEQLGKHVFKKVLAPQSVRQPTFMLNRLRTGFDALDAGGIDLVAHRVEKLRFAQARVRSFHPPACDFTIKPPSDKNAPDVTACMAAHNVSHPLLGRGFNIVEGVLTVFFHPVQAGKPGRTLHIELKQTGISNLRDMEEADARLAEALLLALGVMQHAAPEPGLATSDQSSSTAS